MRHAIKQDQITKNPTKMFFKVTNPQVVPIFYFSDIDF